MGAFWRRVVGDSQLRWVGPEKGVHPPRDRGRRQRRVGPVGEGRGQAALEAAGRHDAGGARRLHRLPLHHRRAHAGRGARDPARRAGADARAARARDARATATRRTPPPPAGSATPTRRSAASAARASREGWSHFKIKVGRDLDDDVRRAALIREEIGPGSKADDGREPGVGRRRGDRQDARAGARSIRGGSRSRRAPTTSSVTRRSRARSRRSASRPASSARTASSSSSSCRPARSASARSTPAGSAA